MEEIQDIYKLIKFVSSDEYKNAKLHKEHRDRIVLNLQELYAGKTSKDPTRVAEIVSSAHREEPKYIEEVFVDESRVFVTTKAGRKALNIPLGTLNYIFHEVGLGLSLIVSVLIASIPAWDEIWRILVRIF